MTIIDFINYIYALLITLIVGFGAMVFASKFIDDNIVRVKTRPIYILLLAAIVDALLFYR